MKHKETICVSFRYRLPVEIRESTKEEHEESLRGRISYNTCNDRFEIKIGNRIEDNKEALPEIMKEFDLHNFCWVIIKE